MEILSIVYVLKRLDTGEYYKGSYQYTPSDRWSILTRAKKYKRRCDASNALSTMREYDSRKKLKWLHAEGNFVIEGYKIVKLGDWAL